MTEVSIRPGTGRHSETTERTNEAQEEEKGGQTDREKERKSEEGVRSNAYGRAYTRVTYPYVCGPHRAM